MSRAADASLGRLARLPAALSLSPQWARRLALGLLFGCGLFVLFTFGDYGISNDEEVQHVYGRLLVDFYASGLSDQSAFAYKNLYLYGGLFDLVAAALERVLPMNVWTLRHLLSALFGLGGLAGAWMLARHLVGGAAGKARGEWAGLAALVLLLVTGAWTGAMFTHTKDVPFATTMVWALYFTVRVLPALPRPALRHVIGLGVAIGCAFGLRVGAVFAVFYLGVGMLIAAWLSAPGWPTRAAFFGRSVVALTPAMAFALALLGLFWPWAVQAPDNLYKAMTAFSHFSFELYTILDGAVMQNGEVPGHYLLSYLLVRLPEVFLLGVVLALLAGLRLAPRVLRSRLALRAALPWLPVVMAATVPLTYTLLAAPPLYNGLRHFTFLLPPLAVLGGIALATTWVHARAWPRARVLAALGCALLAVGHGVGLARLHPYEYVAYNSLAGGVAGAQERWEQDYWAASLLELSEQLRTQVDLEAAHGQVRSTPYLVAVCAEGLQVEPWLDARFRVTKDWTAADFFMSPTHMDCHTALKGRVIGQVAREGVTLGVLRDRRMLVGDERRPR